MGPRWGVRYHAPLYLHCGMDWLYLGGRPWQRLDNGGEVETGAGDEIPESPRLRLDPWPDVMRTGCCGHREA